MLSISTANTGSLQNEAAAKVPNLLSLDLSPPASQQYYRIQQVSATSMSMNESCSTAKPPKLLGDYISQVN